MAGRKQSPRALYAPPEGGRMSPCIYTETAVTYARVDSLARAHTLRELSRAGCSLLNGGTCRNWRCVRDRYRGSRRSIRITCAFAQSIHQCFLRKAPNEWASLCDRFYNINELFHMRCQPASGRVPVISRHASPGKTHKFYSIHESAAAAGVTNMHFDQRH